MIFVYIISEYTFENIYEYKNILLYYYHTRRRCTYIMYRLENNITKFRLQAVRNMPVPFFVYSSSCATNLT